MYKVVGNLWNNIELEIISNGNEYYVLHGWNGIRYCNCWQVLDKRGLDTAKNNEEYDFEPIYNENFEIVGYNKM